MSGGAEGLGGLHCLGIRAASRQLPCSACVTRLPARPQARGGSSYDVLMRADPEADDERLLDFPFPKLYIRVGAC